MVLRNSERCLCQLITDIFFTLKGVTMEAEDPLDPSGLAEVLVVIGFEKCFSLYSLIFRKLFGFLFWSYLK